MNDFTRTIFRSVIAGIIASMAMGAFAMLAAATYQDAGFFTPLYHIASVFVSPNAMMQSTMAAGAGTTFTFVAGPAIVGLMVHLMAGAAFGALFGLGLTRVPNLGTAARVGAGAAYGVIVFAVSALVLLPITSSIAQDADAIRNMAVMVGYPTFLAEHLLFGVVLGALTVSATATAAVPATARSRAQAQPGRA